MQGREGDLGSFAYEAEFTRVNPRKKRKGKRKEHATPPSDLLMRVKEELLATDGGWLQGCIEIFHDALRRAHIRPQKVLCLGLGSPSSSRDARAQLALLGHLCASAHIDSADVLMYDPVFTDADAQLFQTLGMRCLDHVQGSEHALDCPTVLYMPHCDLALYERVIRANWTLKGLCQVVLVANCFRHYMDNNAGRRLEKESPYLLKLMPFVEGRPLPTPPAFPSAFNNLAVQYVTRPSLSLQPAPFWRLQSLGYKTN